MEEDKVTHSMLIKEKEAFKGWWKGESDT